MQVSQISTWRSGMRSVNRSVNQSYAGWRQVGAVGGLLLDANDRGTVNTCVHGLRGEKAGVRSGRWRGGGRH